MFLGRDYIQEQLDRVLPGWVITGRLGAGTYGSVYEICRRDFLTEQGGRPLVCALKVLYMEMPVREEKPVQVSDRDEGDVVPLTSRILEWRERKTEAGFLNERLTGSTSSLFMNGDQAGGGDSTTLNKDQLIYHRVSGTMMDDFIRDVSNEVNTMIDLKGHPHIVSIEDFNISRDDQSCMIMIRMEKLACLAGAIREGRQIMSRENVIRLGIDICKALELCEQKNVIHRDIKPSNLFFSDITGFKLGDFGISRTMESIYDSASMSGVGTPDYMAPEIFYGRRYNNTADLYSLGIVLYQLANDSYLPFIRENLETAGERRSREAFMRRMSGEKLPAPAQADQQLASLILKACSYAPEGRFSTAAEMRAALEKCLDSPVPGGSSGNKSFWLKTGAGILAVLLILAAGLVWHSLSGRTNSSAADSDPQTDVSTADGGVPAEVDVSIGKGDEPGTDERPDKETALLTDSSADPEEEGLSTASSAALEEAEFSTDPITALEEIEDQELAFADPALEKAVRTSLLQSGFQIEEDEPLTRKTALQVRELDLGGGGKEEKDRISDLTGLSAFENLEDLDLQKNKLSDIGELAAMKNLKKLKLESNQVSSLVPLSGLKDLKTLEAAYNEISDLTPIYSLKNLGLLEVIGNRIASIKGIGSLNKLHTLRIGDNQLKDISPVGELNDLTYLGFGYNDVEDISVLYSLPMLHYLTMSGNRIRDISPVLEMKELKWLEVTGNPIEDESVFDNLPESVKHLEK